MALSAWILMAGGVGRSRGVPPGLFQERQWSAAPRTPLPPTTDPFLVVDAPLVVLAHHHLDAPLPVIALQDHGLGRTRRGLSETAGTDPQPSPNPHLGQPLLPRAGRDPREGPGSAGRQAGREVPPLSYLRFPVLISLRPLQGGHEATHGALPLLHI